MSQIITEADLDITTTTLVAYKTQYSKQLYTDKDSVIWNSITHTNCTECNKLITKLYTHCEDCIYKNNLQRYNSKPLLDTWDYPIYSYYLDKYFNYKDELLDYIEDEDLNEYLFYPCKPNTLPELEYDLDTEDDYELPEHIQVLLDQLNKLAVKEIVNYSPDYRYRIIVEIT